MVNPSPRDKSQISSCGRFACGLCYLAVSWNDQLCVVTSIVGGFTHICNPRSLRRLLASLLLMLPGIVHPVTVQTILQYTRTVG